MPFKRAVIVTLRPLNGKGCIQIYNDLPAATRETLEGMTIRYTLDLRYSEQRFGLPKGFREIRAKGAELAELAKTMPFALHPAVWTRASGEKVVHLSPYGCRGVQGMDTAEAYALLTELWAKVEASMKVYFHQWKPDDMLVWDNWRMLHQACGCDPSLDRVMHRTTIKGDYGFGRWETEPKAALAPAEMM